MKNSGKAVLLAGVNRVDNGGGSCSNASIMKRLVVLWVLAAFVQVMLLHPVLHRLQRDSCACGHGHHASDGETAELAADGECPSCQLAQTPVATAPVAVAAVPLPTADNRLCCWPPEPVRLREGRTSTQPRAPPV